METTADTSWARFNMLINCVAYQNGTKLADISVETISDYVGWPLPHAPIPLNFLRYTLHRTGTKYRAGQLVPATSYGNSNEYIIPFDNTNSRYGIATGHASQYSTMTAFSAFAMSRATSST
jgi:hypothetical protein